MSEDLIFHLCFQSSDSLSDDESERDVSKRDDGSSSLDGAGTSDDDSSESEDNDDIREIRILVSYSTLLIRF